jgi:hypothetical protein
VATRRCHYCEVVLRDGNATRDHIMPKAWGGLNAQWNIVIACKKCNNEKGASFPSCKCEKCTIAYARWAAGEKTEVTRYSTPDVWSGPSAGNQNPERCLAACARFGCAFPTKCYRLEG